MAILFKSNFETGDLTGWNINAAGVSPSVVSHLSRNGTYALKAHVEIGEKRSEVVAKRAQRAIIGNEYWYGFSTFLPEPFPDSETWEVIAQWHGTPDFDIGEEYRVTNIGLNIGNAHRSETRGEWTLNVAWDDREVGPLPVNRETFEFGSYKTDAWTDWVFHILWSYETDGPGFLEIWKNDRKILTRNGPNCFNDATGPYFVMGVYRPNRSTGKARTIYHDEFRMADANGSYEDVAPGGKPPEPEPKPPVSGIVTANITIPSFQVPVTINWTAKS